jgi:23S rRNA pseudouridine1911/1915/1917 synthase
MTSMPQHVFTVDRREADQTLAAFLRGKLHLSWSQVKKLVEGRHVRVAGQLVADPAVRLKTGKRVEVRGESSRKATKAISHAKPRHTRVIEKPEPPYQGPEPKIIYQDDAVVVVDKPPGLTTTRSAEDIAEFGARAKRYLPATLADRLSRLLGVSRKILRPVHRIDRDTSGLVVFALNRTAEQKLTEQFREHSVDRRYLALTRGTPRHGRIESHLVRDRGDGRRGSGEANQGQRAITHIRVLQEYGPFALVECRLETGRTHQVRIHLGEQGTPLCGERLYDRPLHGPPLPDDSGARRPMLHAARLGFHHPETDEWMQWESELPDDVRHLLDALRRR